MELRRIEKRVGYLSRKFPWLRELLRAYAEVSKISEGLSGTGTKWMPGEKKSLLRKKRLENGFPLISPEEIVVDMVNLTRLSIHIMEVLSRTSGVIADLLEMIREGRLDIPLCARHFLMRDEGYFEKELGLSEAEIETLYFVLGRAMKPQMDVLAERHGELLEGIEWRRGYCPFCGFPPLVGYVEKEAPSLPDSLKVVCALCETHWHYPFDGCVYCGDREEKGRRLMHLQGKDAFAKCCVRCRSYFKFIELYESPEDVSFALEDLATITLDIRANNLGFARRGTFKVQ